MSLVLAHSIHTRDFDRRSDLKALLNVDRKVTRASCETLFKENSNDNGT